MIQSLPIASDDTLHAECRGVHVIGNWGWSAGRGDGGGDELRRSCVGSCRGDALGSNRSELTGRATVEKLFC